MRTSRFSASLTSRTRAFRMQARAFCNLIAGHEHIPLRHFLHSAHQSLPALYALGLQLPGICPEHEASYTRVSVEEWRRLFRSLSTRLGDRVHYSGVFDAYDRRDGQALIGNLADDLADVHADLENGLRCWRAGDHENAVWEWHFMLECHWGEHATDAIRALYWLRRDVQYGPVPCLTSASSGRTRASRPVLEERTVRAARRAADAQR